MILFCWTYCYNHHILFFLILLILKYCVLVVSKLCINKYNTVYFVNLSQVQELISRDACTIYYHRLCNILPHVPLLVCCQHFMGSWGHICMIKWRRYSGDVTKVYRSSLTVEEADFWRSSFLQHFWRARLGAYANTPPTETWKTKRKKEKFDLPNLWYWNSLSSRDEDPPTGTHRRETIPLHNVSSSFCPVRMSEGPSEESHWREAVRLPSLWEMLLIVQCPKVSRKTSHRRKTICLLILCQKLCIEEISTEASEESSYWDCVYWTQLMNCMKMSYCAICRC